MRLAVDELLAEIDELPGDQLVNIDTSMKAPSGVQAGARALARGRNAGQTRSSSGQSCVPAAPFCLYQHADLLGAPRKRGFLRDGVNLPCARPGVPTANWGGHPQLW